MFLSSCSFYSNLENTREATKGKRTSLWLDRYSPDDITGWFTACEAGRGYTDPLFPCSDRTTVETICKSPKSGFWNVLLLLGKTDLPPVMGTKEEMLPFSKSRAENTEKADLIYP